MLLGWVPRPSPHVTSAGFFDFVRAEAALRVFLTLCTECVMHTSRYRYG